MSNDKPQTPIQREYIDSVQTLLSQARQSTKDAQSARRKQHKEQLQAFWKESRSQLREYITDNDYLSEEEAGALESIRRDLNKCQATSLEGFQAWAIKHIERQPRFKLALDALKRFDSHVSNFLDDAKLRHERYTTFPEHEKVGDRYYLNMGTKEEPIVWTIPEQWWGFVQRVWPVHLKQKPDGSYFVVKKIAGQTVSVHRLLFTCGPGDTVQATKGNFLDWTGLFVRPFNRSKIYEGQTWGRQGRSAQEEFETRFKGMPVLESVGVHPDGSTQDYNPQPVPVNANLERAGCLGKIGPVGWVKSFTLAEKDDYAPTRWLHVPVETLAKRLAAQKLEKLGL
jgi:hypothetical protein